MSLYMFVSMESCFLLMLLCNGCVMDAALQGMLIMCPFFDDLKAFREFEYTTPCVIRICKLADAAHSLYTPR